MTVTAATQTPAASTPAPTAAPVAAAAPAPTQGGGFLDHIKISGSSPADKQTPNPANSPAPAAAPGITPAPDTPPAGTPTPSTFKATIRGREFTGEDLAKAYEHSTNEGLRLKDSEKQAIARATAAEARALEIEEKANSTPPFKVLTKDELTELTPAEQTEYVLKKNAWETQQENRKKEIGKIQEARKAAEKETKDYIYSRTQHMFENASEFPGYKDLLPAMEQILDRVPSLGGMKETPDILYYAALGLQKYREGRASTSAEEKAKADAAAQAAAQAAANGSGNPPAPVGGSPQDDDSDEAFNKRLLSKAPARLFS